MIYKVLLAALTFVSFVSGQRCPSADTMLPCICNEEFTFELRCEVGTEFNIKEYFERISPTISEDTIFEQLTILRTVLTEIPSGATQSLKFKYIYINYNPSLSYIAPDAFKGSENITDSLFIQGTQINNTVFDLINSLPKLEWVTMADNMLESIPPEAFGPLDSLNRIYIGASNVASIGSRAFSKLTALKNFQCLGCNIFPETWGSDSFEGVPSDFTLDLSHNTNWSFLNETLWKPVLDNVGGLVIGGEYDCGFVGCRTREFDCDERADWICSRGQTYVEKISGFYCTGGNGVTQISDYCSER